LINQFVVLIDNINQLINTLDNLIKAGFPNLQNLTLKIENSIAFDANDREKDLQKIIDEYKKKNKDFRKIVKEGYKKYPLLRSFYGKQFIQLYEKAKNNKDNKDNISHLVNSMTYIK
jgi:ABC-type transporter Mla subunit MlaD